MKTRKSTKTTFKNLIGKLISALVIIVVAAGISIKIKENSLYESIVKGLPSFGLVPTQNSTGSCKIHPLSNFFAHCTITNLRYNKYERVKNIKELDLLLSKNRIVSSMKGISIESDGNKINIDIYTETDPISAPSSPNILKNGILNVVATGSDNFKANLSSSLDLEKESILIRDANLSFLPPSGFRKRVAESLSGTPVSSEEEVMSILAPVIAQIKEDAKREGEEGEVSMAVSELLEGKVDRITLNIRNKDTSKKVTSRDLLDLNNRKDLFVIKLQKETK